MINLLLGPPGGGKSYEAVVYHILPALAKGRKVITNLPLDLERIAQLDACYLDLIEIRIKTKAVKPEKDWDKAESLYKKFGIAAKTEYWVDRPFAHPEDYGDEWRHPETGSGPLYVIDECHLALPRTTTKIAVEEWFSLHRHESADVLLITQSYGKVSKSVIDLVQVCYRVKKATAFGSAKKYIRKVQDGVRGEVVNTSIREYQKRYFGLYKSHTRGGGAELAAEDIVPIWKRWPFLGAAFCLILFVGVLVVNGGFPNPMKTKLSEDGKRSKIVKREGDPMVSAAPTPLPSIGAVPATDAPAANVSLAVAANPEPEGHPYAGRTLHLVGRMVARGKSFYQFVVAQNGQRVSDVTGEELQYLGYEVKTGTGCAAQVRYGDWATWVICDAPQVAIFENKGKTGKDAKKEGDSGKTANAAPDPA
ncbi:zonular occludens toxin domain-containing protein [Propionivibrio limicola]|uniref:zonular occludens toxin domain-containing protein n=1 Tax=Propionivibrio limicola TaxID=167645 RepID=UPI001291407A|nr:zonular occludens toxin domain-containing protein [Propionivibrio limicola]